MHARADSEPRSVVIRLNPTVGSQWQPKVQAPIAVITIETPPERWHFTAPGIGAFDSTWQAVEQAVAKGLRDLRALDLDTYDAIHVFPLAPYGIGALLAMPLFQWAEAHAKRVAFYQWRRDDGSTWFESWGPMGLPRVEAAAQQWPLQVELPIEADYEVGEVALVVSIAQRLDRRAIALAVSTWTSRRAEVIELDLGAAIDRNAIAGPAEAEQAVRELTSALDALKRAYPSARRHLFYAGPLALLMRVARGFHVPGGLWVYDFMKDGAYVPTARFPAARLWLPEKRAAEIFIAADEGRSAEVRPLVHALERYGVEVFFAPVSLRPGDRWDTRTQEAVEAARLVAVFVVADTNEDWYQREEVAVSIDRARAGEVRVVPLVVDEDARHPYGLRRVTPMEWPGAERTRCDEVARDLVALLRSDQYG